MAVSQIGSKPLGERLESIDALRGMAALYILLYHLALIPQPNLPVPRWASSFVLAGGTGVTIFFMVSAFCLCSSMQFHKQEPRLTVRFYLRRFFRIAPLFYVWIVITLLRDKYWFGVTHSWTDILLSVFFGFNFVPGKQEGFVWASWILSVQMMFYLLFPIIYRYVNDLWKSLSFFFLALLTAEGYAFFIAYLPIADFQRASFVQFSFFRQLPIFALGMVDFFLYDRHIQGKIHPRSLAVALVAAAVFGYTALLSGRLNILFQGLYWQGVIYSGLLLGLSIAPLGLFVNRVTRFYGKISYSIYLNHPTLVFALVPVYRIFYGVNVPTTFQYGACLMVTLGLLTAISYCTHRFIEEPGMRLGKQLIKKIASQ
jgi:peptidoglycan/LPS O-acetylase OafA/YrhL